MQGGEGPGPSRISGQLMPSGSQPAESEAGYKGRDVKYARVMNMLPTAADRFFRRVAMDCLRYKVAILPAMNPAMSLPKVKPESMRTADFNGAVQL